MTPTRDRPEPSSLHRARHCSPLSSPPRPSRCLHLGGIAGTATARGFLRVGVFTFSRKTQTVRLRGPTRDPEFCTIVVVLALDSERKCADTTGTVLVAWASHFQCRLKYKYNFQIKYTEAILSSSTRELLRFEISKMLTAV